MMPILDLKKQIAPVRKQIDAAIKKVIDNADFILGKEVTNLENGIRIYAAVKYAIGVCNGTDAIKLGLLGCGIKPGDGVICPAFTYYATAGAVASIGARPIFADIDLGTYNISIDSIEKALEYKKKMNISAIIPVHLYGACADMDNILKIAKEHKLKVIEDTAQAFGAEYKGKKAGTIGDCGALSFFPSKNLGAFGDAGMVLTNNKSIEGRVRILRNQGSINNYNHLALGYNNRMDTIQAAVLNIKLRYLDSWNRKRQENARYLNNKLQGLSIKAPLVPENTTHIYHQYVLRLEHSSSKLIGHLRKKGIDARVYYPIPLHLQKCFKYLGYKRNAFPNSEEAAEKTLAIPVYPDLTKKEMDCIAESIREFLR